MVIQNNVFSEVLQDRRQKAVIEKKEYRDLVVIPYVAGLSEAIRRVCDTVGIKTVFSLGDSLKKRLTQVKPKGKGKEKDLIYKFHVNVVQSTLEKLEDHWILESASIEGIG
jgi:hypothetical protein